MNCPRCPKSGLERRLTDRGVEVELCPSCSGAWLDRGEIFSFTKDPAGLHARILSARNAAVPGSLASPATGAPMNVLSIGGVEVDECPKTGGIWLDAGELERLGAAGIKIRLDAKAKPPAFDNPLAGIGAAAAALRPLPSLWFRSGMLLLTLYGLLGLVLIAAVEGGMLETGVAVAITLGVVGLQFLLSPWLMDLQLSWLYHASRVEESELPEHLRTFVRRVCAERKLNFPRFWIIDDGAPNAFTYGHYPGNARIAITRGLAELLDPDELEGVVAHEIGHAVHWDMVLMTAAQVVPMLAYYVYRATIRGKVKKGSEVRLAVAIGAYLVYIVSQYLVLWFSRTREYHADRFAGTATGRPNALATALVKVAYGLASQQPAQEGAARKADSIGAMGIFDVKAARSLAIAGGRTAGSTTVDRAQLEDAMKWDLWNPWAKYYEIHSTHPLVANRLMHLGNQAVSMGQAPFVIFSATKPESYWDEFLVDVSVLWLPTMVFLAGLGVALGLGQPWMIGVAVSLSGFAMMLRLLFQYRGEAFPEHNVASLLKHVKVSGIRPVPCTLLGRVIGKGVPGLIWSEDFVVQDPTGILFLDYRQPLAIWEFLFGLLKAGRWQGEEVVATGWFRRAPVPYLELRSIAPASNPADSTSCWVKTMKWVTAGLVVAGGIALAAFLASGRF